MMGISDKQAEMLAFIENFVGECGYPPTYEEIKTGLNISSKSLVNYHLQVLENAQLLSRVPNTPRGIQLKNNDRSQQLPLAGTVAERQDTPLATLSPADVLELTVNCVTNDGNLYALGGGTFADGFVNRGDIVILQGQSQASDGELVAIRLPKKNQISLKRYFRENGHVRLKSVSAAHADLVLKPADVEIRGKVVAVIRQNG